MLHDSVICMSPKRSAKLYAATKSRPKGLQVGTRYVVDLYLQFDDYFRCECDWQKKYPRQLRG